MTTEPIQPIDVHIDSDHRWDTDRVLELDAYAMVRNSDGEWETDTFNTIASVRIPSEDYSVDIWIDTRETVALEQLPPHVRAAYERVVASARGDRREQEK